MESVEVAECNSFEHHQAPPDRAAFIRSITDNKVTKLRVIGETSIGSHYEDDFFIPNTQRKHAMIRFGKSMTGTGWHIKLVHGHYLYINGVLTIHKKWLLLKEGTTIGITKHNWTSSLIEFENVNRSSTSLLASEESAVLTTLPKGGVSDIPPQNSSLAVSNILLDRSPEEEMNDPSELQNVHPKIKVRAISPPTEFHGFIQSISNGSNVNLRRSFDTTIGSDKIDTYCVQQAKEEHAKIRFGQSPLGIGWHIRLKNGKSFYINNIFIEHREWRLLPEFNVISITGDAATAFSVELANEIRSPASSNANPRKRKSADGITFQTPSGFPAIGSGINEGDHYTPHENACVPSSSFTPKRPRLSERSLQPSNSGQTNGNGILPPRSSSQFRNGCTLSSPKVNQPLKPSKKKSAMPKYQQSKIDNFFAPVKNKGNAEKLESNDPMGAVCENSQIGHNQVTNMDDSGDHLLQTDSSSDTISSSQQRSLSNESLTPKTLSARSSLLKKYSKLHPYLMKYNASDDVINSLKKITTKFVNLVAQSSEERLECIAMPKDLTHNAKKKWISSYRRLVRVRYGKGLITVANKSIIERTMSQIDDCKLKHGCLNLFHHRYKEDNTVTQIQIGGYKFSKSSNSWRSEAADYWVCRDCANIKQTLRKGKTVINGTEYHDQRIGYLRMNKDSNELEDPTNTDYVVNPHLPGGKPHICQNKEEFAENLKKENSAASLKNVIATVDKNMEELERELDGIFRDIDESKVSETLKLFLEKFRNIFKFDKNHRRFYVYFITVAGSTKIIYYGITSDPKHRLYDHRRKRIFAKELKSGAIEMHILPLGNINFMMASELETSLIRLSKADALKFGGKKIKNISTGGQYNISSVLTDCLKARSSKNIRSLKKIRSTKNIQSLIANRSLNENRSLKDLISSLDELLQYTFDFGLTILSTDSDLKNYSSTIVAKRRITAGIKKLKQVFKKSVSKRGSSAIMPNELKNALANWKTTFEFSPFHTKYYLYFFIYKNEVKIRYYGITCNPNGRREDHITNVNSAAFNLFQNEKEVEMYVVPLGDMNIMLAAELETMLIRLSKRGYLNDGNCNLNVSDGSYYSRYSYDEKTVVRADGVDFDELVLVLNQLIEFALDSKKN